MLYESDLAIGIDLGTTNSVIGYWNSNINEVELIPNSIGEVLTPSIVIFNGDECLVGEQAQKYLIPKGEKIYSVKRILGRNFSDDNLEDDKRKLNYKIINKNNLPMIEITNNGKSEFYTPKDISSLILKKLIESAEKFLKNKIKKVVITVPAHFNHAQRTETKSAAEDIGLEVLQLLNEPTAAALSYGFGQNCCPKKKYKNNFIKLLHENRMGRNNECSDLENSTNSSEDKNNNITYRNLKNILVFDLGGGTYDLAILEIKNNGNSDIEKDYKVLSKKAINIGGNNFDEKILEYCFNNFGQNINNLQGRLSYKNTRERLLKNCELYKRILSKEKNAMLKINNFYEESDFIIDITREQFETEICKDLFLKISEPFDDLLSESKLKKNDIDEIILVGGASKMPKIKEILKNYFGDIKINCSINPDQIVAYGATILAGMILNSKNCYSSHKILKNIKLQDITPYSLGTDVIDKVTKKPKMNFIIPKGTVIPTNLETPFVKEYRTTEDNQNYMLIRVYEGEDQDLQKNNFLGEFKIYDLPQKPKGEVICEVRFHIDENNILIVTGKEKTGGKPCGIQITNGKTYDIDKKQIKIDNNLKVIKICENEGEKKMRFNDYIEDLCDSYNDCKNDNERYVILVKYEEAVEDLLQEINIENFKLEDTIEKYYSYVYQLFEAYVEMFFLNKEVIIKNKIENKIKNEVNKYLNILKSGNIYYIKSLVNLFGETKNIKENYPLFFYSLVLDEINIFNNIALSYIDLEHKQKYSRYYAKLYFTESISLFDKYINSTAKALLGINNRAKIDNLRTVCTTKLEEINSNAVLLISASKKNAKLFDPLEFQKILEESGYTFYENNFLLYHRRTSEEYILVLDEFEKTLDRIEISLKDKKMTKSNDLLEEKAICLGSIVKIKLNHLGQKKYEDYLKCIDNCIYYAENPLKKNKNECEWYKEALDLKRNLLNKIEESKNGKIKKIDEIFSKKDNIGFINFILNNHPYKGYNQNSREPHLNWNKIDIRLVDFLIDKYTNELNERKLDKQKTEYIIINNILEKLRSLQNEFKRYTNDIETNH